MGPLGVGRRAGSHWPRSKGSTLGHTVRNERQALKNAHKVAREALRMGQRSERGPEPSVMPFFRSCTFLLHVVGHF